jgi:hypothetical protein
MGAGHIAELCGAVTDATLCAAQVGGPTGSMIIVPARRGQIWMQQRPVHWPWIRQGQGIKFPSETHQRRDCHGDYSDLSASLL